MKVGDMVRNVMQVRTNPVVNESRGWKPIEPGYIGIVTSVKQTDMNAWINSSGKGDVYVDVVLSVDGESVRCGNYGQSTFEVIV
jgi:CRISPR/Cas system-associated exonuclease Cas4 (RecB family)